jgi:hypothetical protein
MVEPKKTETREDFAKRHPWAASMAFEGPWTEQDEIWAEWMTGEYEERVKREACEREAREADL